MVSVDFKMVQWFQRMQWGCLSWVCNAVTAGHYICTMAQAAQMQVTFSKVSKSWVGTDNLDPLSKFWSSVSGCGIIPACAQGHKGGKPPWKISSPTLSEAGHNPILNYRRKAVLIWGEKRAFAREMFSGRSYTIATRKVIVRHRLVFVPVPFTEQA